MGKGSSEGKQNYGEGGILNTEIYHGVNFHGHGVFGEDLEGLC